MKARIDYTKVSPQILRPLIALNAPVETSGLERPLLDLVRMRASQINGCAFCLDMHSKDARAAGEKEQRLYMLEAWRETSVYSDRERAALAWTESLTGVAKTGASDEDYEPLKRYFNETEIAYLTLLIGAINVWNRVAIALRAVHPVEEHKSAAA